MMTIKGRSFTMFIMAVVYGMNSDQTVEAFTQSSSINKLNLIQASRSNIPMFAVDNDDNDGDIQSRREMLIKGGSSILGAAFWGMSNVPSAQASYSAYTSREKDWQDRSENGEINYS